MNDRALALQDEAARAQALDVTRSWLVQAPAGSGKTGLLIARFLALLAGVDRPERIVAATFTRKAAAEMQERIVRALREAGEALSRDHGDYDASLHRLARAALEQDRRMGWRLLEQPGRLRILTIDALAAAIARQAPIAAGLGALPGFVDDAQALHREAARAALESAPASDPHWHAFLQWQDNDAGAATRLIAQMLGARDRWPARMLDEDATTLRAEMERALAHEARAAVRVVRERLPQALARTLPVHAAVAVDAMRAADASPSCRFALELLARERRVPPLDAREAWCALADWLLTGKGTFLKRPTVEHGFPGKGNGPDASERVRRKADFIEWLQQAAAVPGLADASHRLRQLPPARFDDASWTFVVAAMNVLANAAHALDRVFAQRKQADFAEATLRALAALGSTDEPSDLLLAIDYRLAHLLIDEFQDTSRAQLTLLTRLTEGWQPGDGRTLFAVGDPMQSIYRFRQAEVALFLQAQQSGVVGNVPVGVIELARNFRSQPAIVSWVNDVFGDVLPPVSDPARSEAAYRAAYVEPAQAREPTPSLELFATRSAEAQAVVRAIGEARAAGIEDVAILVRARSHAQALLPELRRAGISYSAVDLEGLRERLATRDLLSLARAIAQPADRLAWLAVLHAPWCGLHLSELLTIAEASAEQPFVDAIARDDVAAKLDRASASRLARFRDAVAPALAARGHASFALRVRSAWLALGGPACAGSALDRDGADRVFALLAEHERGGDLADFDALSSSAAQLFAEAAQSDGPGVQIMTLHKAKGLQFDAVILPGLDLPAGRGEAPLLRWKVREHEGERTLVLAPMRARVGANAADDPVYEWLGRLDAAEEAAELGRLLYVGATRAKRRLHLIGVAQVDRDGRWKRPARGTALERLWDAVVHRLTAPDEVRQDEGAAGDRDGAGSACLQGDASDRDHAGSVCVRLPDDWTLPALPARLPVVALPRAARDVPAFEWADATAAAVGTVAHRLLAQLAIDGIDAWDGARIAAEWPRILAELGGEGVGADRREESARRIGDIVARTLRDPRGRWLFDPAHEDAHSEWALAGDDEGRIVHVVLDRSFVAGGFRYIVDFKTGGHLGGGASTFLAREFERYRPQLARYARIVRAFDARPVKIALYHPLVEGGWQEMALQ